MSCLRSRVGSSGGVSLVCVVLHFAAHSSPHRFVPSQPLHFAVLEPPVGHSSCHCRASRGRKPLRFVRSSLHCEAGSFRCGEWMRVPALLRLAAGEKRGHPLAAVFGSYFWVALVRESRARTECHLTELASFVGPPLQMVLLRRSLPPQTSLRSPFAPRRTPPP